MLLRRHVKSRIIKFLRVIGYAFCVSSFVAFGYDWDPSRVFYKRLKAADEYVYDELRPLHKTFNPEDFITIKSGEDRDQLREKLRSLVWGGDVDPSEIRPTVVRKDVLHQPVDTSDCVTLQSHPSSPTETLLLLKCQHRLYADVRGLQSLDELILRVGPVYETSIAYFRPRVPNGTLIVYQNGYASTYHHQYRHIERLINAGYTVAALNHTGYGETLRLCEKFRSTVGPWCEIGWGTSTVPRPMRVLFSPIMASVGHGLDSGNIDRVAMIGFSAGGWLTVVASAIDPRIKNSYTIGGVMPRFLQETEEIAPNQLYRPYQQIGSLLDQFILGADLPGRRQVQFFNRYDRCCYRNTRSLLYRDHVANAIRAVGGGFFDVRIDETHPRHKISKGTLEAILDDLKQGKDDD